MADGKGFDICGDVYDGNLCRFCRYTCHDRVARDGDFPYDFSSRCESSQVSRNLPTTRNDLTLAPLANLSL